MADITIWGGLPRDAELRYTQNGKPFATFTVADAARYKDDQGQWQSRDESYTDVVFWGDSAETVGTFKKGTQVAVLGRLVTRKFEHNGQQRSALEVKAQKVAEVVRAGSITARSSTPQEPWGQPAPQASPAQPDVWGAPGTSYNDETPF